jgi:hypothetical protein
MFFDKRREITRAFLASTLAAVTLGLCVAPDASADWRHRGPARFDHGRRVVYRHRVPPIVVTPPVSCPVVPTTGYFGGWWGYSYRHHHGHYRHYRYRHHGYHHRR